jgi:hypothetical protein
VPDSEQLKSIKRTEAASVATQQATESAAWHAAAQTEIQNAALQESQRAARAAERDRAEALQVQQDHNWSIWIQTPHGRVFEEWSIRARALISRIEGRDYRWSQVWESELSAHIPPEELAMVKTGRFAPASRKVAAGRTVRNWGYFFLIATPVLLVVGFIVSFFSTVWSSWGLVTLVVGLVMTPLGAILIASDRTWKSQNLQMKNQFESNRVARFGFDPVLEPARRPLDWNLEAAYSAGLAALLRGASVSHPAPESLPMLHLPRVRATGSEPNIALRKVLEEFEMNNSTSEHEI